MTKKFDNRLYILITLFFCTVLGWPAPSIAESTPRYFDPELRISTPLLVGLPRLRFLTSLDFPPFNFADANKRPTGMNVDLARAICEVLGIESKCEIQALPWRSLETALDAKRGEAIIAGTAISAAKRENYGLSYPYFRFPGRFVAKREAKLGIGETMQRIGLPTFIKVMELEPIPQMVKMPRENPYVFWQEEEVEGGFDRDVEEFRRKHAA